METQVLNATEYRNVPLALLNESATNPRRTFEATALKELAESIRSQGVLSPLLVRPLTENPIEMVRVKDSTKRRKRPMILTNDTFHAILASLPEPYRTMVVVAQCLGLRVSEITGLQWSDLDTEHRQLLVQRSVVNGRVDDVKTEYSHDHVPIHESLLEVLLAWSEQCPKTKEGWMFPNPLSNKPYYSTEIQKRYLRTSGCCVVPCPACGVATGEWCVQSQPTANSKRVVIHELRKTAAGKFADIGWHTSATRIVRGWTRPERR